MKICVDMIYKVSKFILKYNSTWNEKTICSECKKVDCVCDIKKSSCKLLLEKFIFYKSYLFKYFLKLIKKSKNRIKAKSEK